VSEPIRKPILHKLKKFAWMASQRPKGFWAFCRTIPSAWLRTERAAGRPAFLTIEPTSACDLGCPVCETGAKIIDRPVGQMSFENFQRVIAQVRHHTNSIQLYFMGESFWHPRIYDMIRHAKDQGIYVTIYSNGSVLDPERTVRSGLDEINFNIGGMTQATHQTYRINSSFDRVCANIRGLVEARKRLGGSGTRGPLKTPQINVGFIVMKHNEHEVEEFVRTVSGWGVDRVHVVDPCVRNMAQAIQMLPEDKRYWFYDEAAFRKGILRPKVLPENRCDWIYFSSVITWNGNVVPCCRDPKAHHIMGNVFREDFGKIWNGPKYRAFRKQIRSDQGTVDICRLCSSYQVPALRASQPPAADDAAARS